MTEFALYISIVFLPGIVWCRMHETFTKRRSSAQFDFVVNSFVFGLVAHVVTFATYHVLRAEYAPNLFIALSDLSELGRFLDEVVASVGVAIALGIVWIYCINYRVPIRILQHIKATRVFDEDDVWDFTFNQRGPTWEYVDVRDYSQSRVYSGFVKSWSDAAATRELLLNSVRVFDMDTSEELYSVPCLYLARSAQDITVEFQVTKERVKDVKR